MEIDIDKYLTEEDKKQIVQEEFCTSVQTALATEKDMQRILSNCCYSIVQKMVDEVFSEDLNTILKDKTVDIIKDLSSFNVFKRQDAWQRDESKGWVYLQQAMEDNKELIHSRVKDAVENYLTDEGQEGYIQDMAAEAVYKVISDKLTGV